MSKKAFIISLVVLVLVVVGLMVVQAQLKPAEEEHSNAPTDSNNQDWVTYTNSEIDVSLQHPDCADVEIHDNNGDDMVVISHAGPTQAEGTEFYDGFSVGVTAHEYPTITDLEMLAQAELEANLGSGQVVEEVTPVTIAGLSGYKYTFAGLGTSTTYYLPKNENEYIVAYYFAEDPTNAGYEQIATDILASLKVLDY